MVEVGPGRGALTRGLLQRCARVVAVELDADLAAGLHERCGHHPALRVVRSDILRCDLAALAGSSEPERSVVTGNLPFYITSPTLRRVFDARRAFRSATFLVQEEVADRIVARPGSRAYGYLSCICQLYSTPAKLFSVEPEAFTPPPRVRSSLVTLAMHWGERPQRLQEFLAASFRSPRKTLRNNLSRLYGKAAAGSDPCSGLRAQQLDLRELTQMWRRLDRG